VSLGCKKTRPEVRPGAENAVNLQTNLADVLKLTCLIAHILSKSLHLRFFSKAESLRRSAAI
jgi:NTP pyrophosphatase (non-canonical NTP hydrolase)